MRKFIIKHVTRFLDWLKEWEHEENTTLVPDRGQRIFVWKNGIVSELKSVERMTTEREVHETTGVREKVTRMRKVFEVTKGNGYLTAANKKAAVKKFRQEGFPTLQNLSNRRHPVKIG